MPIDTGYHERLTYLADLMQMDCNKDKSVRKLMKEALRMYPVQSVELQRHCLSVRFALKAADIVNRKQFPGLYAEKGAAA